MKKAWSTPEMIELNVNQTAMGGADFKNPDRNYLDDNGEAVTRYNVFQSGDETSSR